MEKKDSTEATRRSILTVLGLGAAGVAVSTEALADKEALARGDWPMYCPAYTRKGPEYQDMIAKALENLANSIRNRDAVALNIATVSNANGEDFLTHDVKITVELPVEQSEVRAPKQIRMAEDALAEARKTLNDARAEAAQLRDEALKEAQQIIHKAVRESESL